MLEVGYMSIWPDLDKLLVFDNLILINQFYKYL